MILADYIKKHFADGYNSLKVGTTTDPALIIEHGNKWCYNVDNDADADFQKAAYYSHYCFPSGTVFNDQWKRLYEYIVARDIEIFFIRVHDYYATINNPRQISVVVIPHDTEEEAVFAKVKVG